MLTDELDVQTRLGSDSCGIGAQFITQGFRPVSAIEQADIVVGALTRQGFGATDIRQCR